tara:strand:- start:57 stop:782 length:726 start_codon:yes stop_codon:yes gene_type:complete
MGLYSDSKYLIKEEIETVHKGHFLDFAVAGTWGNSEQRIAIASFAREAGISAGLLEETPNTFAQESNFKLSKVAKLVVEKLAISPKDILKDFFDEVINTGLSEEEYVEIVGIVSRIVDMDIFARGIDHPLIAFPEPGVGSPSKVRPETAKLELAWVSTIPNFPEGGLPAKQLFGEKPPKPYIVRGLSLVPDEVKKHMELEKAQYQPLGNIMNFDLRHHKGLSRAQVEVVAGKVSALNECFY